MHFQDIPSGQVHEFQVMRPNEKILLYKLRLGDEPLLAPVVCIKCWFYFSSREGEGRSVGEIIYAF